MDVTLLYFDGCPNWREAQTRLDEAARVAGRSDVVVTLIPVPTLEDAERVSFRGSPTILINGADPFADANAPVGLACRVFPTPSGLRGAPTVEQLVAALR